MGELKEYIGKEISVVIENGFFYKGRLLDDSFTFVKIESDKTKRPELIHKRYITVLKIEEQ
jgi:small nuclear ribonucleoprotein (snRNP)-like protein